MDIQEHRMQCLRMAFELGGNPEAVISAAEKLLQFVAGPQTAIPAVAVPAAIPESPVDVASMNEQATGGALEHTDETPVATVVADPIAACGTLMTMAPSGHLADATTAAELTPAVAEVSPADSHLVEAASATPIASEVDTATVTDDAAGDLPLAEAIVDTTEEADLHSASAGDVIASTESLTVTPEIETEQPAQQLAQAEDGVEKQNIASELSEHTTINVEEGQSPVQSVSTH